MGGGVGPRDGRGSGGDRDSDDSDDDGHPRFKTNGELPPHARTRKNQDDDDESVRGGQSFFSAKSNPNGLQGSRIPCRTSTPRERELFVKAKYEAMSFVFPHGPITGSGTTSLMGPQAAPKLANGNLPTRLVDYFCVVGSSGLLERDSINTHPSIAGIESLAELRFGTKVIDQFPVASASVKGSKSAVTPLQDHVSQFVFPSGCSPSLRERPPTFFTFVLTSETGQKNFGAAMTVWEDVDGRDVVECIRRSDYQGGLPTWLEESFKDPMTNNKKEYPPGAPGSPPPTPPSTLFSTTPPPAPKGGGASYPNSKIPDILFLPKSLILLSHYPFYSSFQTFLSQLYRISLSSAPLPIER